jgi:predicted phage tail component-like protein
MYNFRDINDASGHAVMPSEALKLNVEYIENLVPGYRTVYVKGREALAPEVGLYDTGTRDGAERQYGRFPERYITVGYQLLAASNEAFRDAFNALGGILNVTDAQLIFNDEPDKYFTGTLSNIGEIEPGRNQVVGEFEFVCTDPFKYSVKEYEIEPTLDNGLCFLVNYKGTYKSFPTLEARMSDSASGCGFVGFFNDNEKIIQLGNPEETNFGEVPASQTIVNAPFDTSNTWGQSVQAQWPANSSVVLADPSYTYTGKAGIIQSAPAAWPDQYYLTATDYGTGNLYHGPTVTRELPADAAGVVGAENFRFSYSQKMSIGYMADGTNQKGAFRAHLLAADGKIVAGVNIWKNGAGKNGRLLFWANNTVMEAIDIDLSYNNKHFGNDRYSGPNGTGTCLAKAVRTTTIQKTGSKITFDVAGIKRTYNVPAAADMVAKYASFTFAKYKEQPTFAYNGVFWAKFIKDNCDTWADVPNMFSENDIVVADCKDGEVYLNNAKMPALGALGNDWEEFYLHPGANQIGVTYSDWLTGDDAPTFKMKYREVYL